MSKQQLAPEYVRALACLESNLQYLHQHVQPKFEDTLLTTHNLQMISGRLTNKDIPRGDTWRWNQTKSRQLIVLQNGELIVRFAKLTPRKTSKKNTGVLPSLKIWHFEVTYASQPTSEFHVIWCEKGYTSETKEEKSSAMEIDTPPQPIAQPSSELSMEDLTFLAKFMPDETAYEFWPANFYQERAWCAF